MQDVGGVAVEQVRELLRALLGLGRGKVDLVERGHDDEPGVARQVEVRERLRLEALGGVDEQHGAFAGLERPRHLVGEVDMAGRVDQVQLVSLVCEPHRLRLDRDAPLTLEIHLVEVLGAHVAARDRVRHLEQPVGEGRLAVVDVGNDAEVADARGVGGHEPMVRARRGPARSPTVPGRPLVRWAAVMANIKSQIKRNKQNEVRRERNKAVRSALKTSQKRVQAAIAEGDADGALERSREVSRALDKAASKGVVHKRTAARRKSRLAKAVNAAGTTE